MKKLLFLSVCISAAMACKKTHEPETGGSIQSNNAVDSNASLSATINGYQWVADSAFGTFIKGSNNDSGMVNLMIEAIHTSSDTHRTVLLNIYNYTSPGTFAITPPYYTAIYYLNNQRHYATSGQIVITSKTAGSMTGTFSFEADSIKITNGSFNVSMP